MQKILIERREGRDIDWLQLKLLIRAAGWSLDEIEEK